MGMKRKTTKPYYLGLDIGTDSVGYAVTDEKYQLCRFKGESMWGSGLFDPAGTCEIRRGFRVARRRLDRRQLRIRLLQEFFAKEIARVDSRFFVRLRESALQAKDRSDASDHQSLFNDSLFKDKDYHRQYPTIHHLIVDLMNNPAPHDPRLVYIACAWLMAHRGHFLQELDLENVASLDDIHCLYDDLMAFMSANEEGFDHYSLMWECEDVEKFGEILASRQSLSSKREALWDLLFEGAKPKPDAEHYRYDRYSLLSLLCGWETTAAKLFNNEERYSDCTDKIFLGADEEKLQSVIAQLDDCDGELIRKLKALYDWAILKEVRRGTSTISAAKVAVYEQHQKDLHWLKKFLRKVDGELFKRVFILTDEKLGNYVAYVCNQKGVKRASKDVFSDWLKKEMAKINPPDEDRAAYEDMMSRLEIRTFLPKQIDGDNRVIPHQLYEVELRAILKNASGYLPFLKDSDKYGTVAEKIESVFAFRVPYFVGPLVSHSQDRGKFAWLKRKADGVIRPWNFEELVDVDATEEAFIGKLIGHCQYYRGDDDQVLPADSLLYREFEVLNEINPLRINGARITSDAKRKIFEGLFLRHRVVTRKSLERFLVQEGIARAGDDIAGVDETLKSKLTSYHDFKGLLTKKLLSADDAEKIVLRSACTEDGGRFVRWLKASFGDKLSDHDIKSLARLKYSGFGRLSRKFLDGIIFQAKDTGEQGTVMDFLREKNVVLMELLSDRYTLGEQLHRIADEYYGSRKFTLEQRLDEMYVSSAVKRQIYRALDIVKTVVKVMGRPPRKLFVEMARGSTPEQKGRRTVSRYDQLQGLYNRIATEEVKTFNDELKKMGASASNRLQGDALFLRFLQFGKCAYCGRPLPIENLKSKANIDHIIPRSKLKDDSVMNNKVLCCSECNGAKGEDYPVPDKLRQDALWTTWYRNGLMTAEKYQRLMRRDQLTDEELQGFINRQLVETRQTTKAIFTILQELYPQTELVAVKAQNVSDFRQEFDLVKCRSINDLHHAKDAYLNIAVGNVYHERFSRRYFNLRERYSLKPSTLFGEKSHVENAEGVAWDGVTSLRQVKATMARNDIHLTKYAFYAKGGFFDQNPKAAGAATIPRKAMLPVSEYGGYAKPSAVGYLLSEYICGKKHDVMVVPINLLDRDVVIGDDENRAREVVARTISAIEGGKTVAIKSFPFGRKLLKVNTVLSLDGFNYVISGKAGGGKQINLRSMNSLVLPIQWERYVKRLESLSKKLSINRDLTIDSEYDKVSVKENSELFDGLAKIVSSDDYKSMPASQAGVIGRGKMFFDALPIREQIATLLSMVALLKTNRAGGCDLSMIKGVGKAGVLSVSSKVSNWGKSYRDVRIVHSDFSGMFRCASPNLLELV